MGKRQFKPGNMLYPVPAVMVSVADKEGNANIITVAWAGTVCTNPPMLTISIRPERYSYHTVSYTHLDVYKRQSMHCPSILSEF